MDVKINEIPSVDVSLVLIYLFFSFGYICTLSIELALQTLQCVYTVYCIMHNHIQQV